VVIQLKSSLDARSTEEAPTTEQLPGSDRHVASIQDEVPHEFTAARRHSAPGSDGRNTGPTVYDIYGDGSAQYKIYGLRARKPWKATTQPSNDHQPRNEIYGGANHDNKAVSSSKAAAAAAAATQAAAAAAVNVASSASANAAPSSRAYDDSAGAGEVVLLAWPRASDHFGYLNYKALESWLHLWPAAKVADFSHHNYRHLFTLTVLLRLRFRGHFDEEPA
jgi:hypothetical protein